MRYILALICMTHTAMAQTALPATMKIYDKDHQVVGTATRSGNTIVVRDKYGELVGSVTIGEGNKQTLRDPDGKIVDDLTLPR
jgi:YD repeat-containing protein